jgi:GNAT superfamily N-acetyltransferase
MKRLLKRLASVLLGDYGLYRVWQSGAPGTEPPEAERIAVRPVGIEDVACAQAPEIRDNAWYLGTQCTAYGVFEDEAFLAMACCWWGERYAERHSWPLPPGAVKLVQIVTAPAARNRGLATLLIRHVAQAEGKQGRNPALARIWHSNTPSMKAFEHAGWHPVGWLIQINPLRRPQPWNLVFRRSQESRRKT